MKRAILASALLLAAPALAQKRLTCGTVDSLEVTSLTRTKATAFLRTTLPASPPGSKIFFEGKIELANTMLPVGQPVMALVQHSEGSHEVVFLAELDLARSCPPTCSEGCTPPPWISRSKEISGPPPVRRRTPCAPPASFASGRATSGRSAPSARTSRGSRARASAASRSTRRRARRRSILYNPLSFALDVRDLAYAIRTGGRTVASGERHGIRVHPGAREFDRPALSSPTTPTSSPPSRAPSRRGRARRRSSRRDDLGEGRKGPGHDRSARPPRGDPGGPVSAAKVLLEKSPADPRVARLVLNRPDVRNAWDGETVSLLQRALRDLASDAVRARRRALGRGAGLLRGGRPRVDEARRELHDGGEPARLGRARAALPRSRRARQARRRARAGRRARRRDRPRRRVRRRRRGRGRGLRDDRGAPRDHSRRDLALRRPEDRRIARARVVPDGRACRRPRRRAASGSSTTSSRRRTSTRPRRP